MLGSDWRHIAKIIGVGLAGVLLISSLILMAFGAGLTSGRYEQEAYSHAAEYAEATEKRVAACEREAQSGRVAECIKKAIESSHEGQRDEKDLKAQRDMAQWAGWLLIVTALQVPIGIAGFVALLLTIDQGRRAMAHSEKVATAQLRPYILPGRTRVRHREGNLWVGSTKFVNSGATPAKDVATKVVFEFANLPLTRGYVPEFEDDGVGSFPFISTVRAATHEAPIVLDDEQVTAIRQMRAIVLGRIRLEYRPTPESPVEVYEGLRMFHGPKFDKEVASMISEWAYGHPHADEKGQEQLSLPPTGEDGAQTPEASEPPAD